MNVRRLFLLDAIGAVFSAVLLGVVLAQWHSMVGIPPAVLYVLAVMAALFSIYSFTCFLLNASALFLRIIAIVNILYCCLTLGLILFQHQTITALGVAYFLGEIAIVLWLASWEWRLARQSERH